MVDQPDIMTKSDKIKATKAANKKRMESQTITVDKNWKILRSDPMNWEIQYKGKFQGYYGRLGSALSALPLAMLDEQAKGTLNNVLECLETIRRIIKDLEI